MSDVVQRSVDVFFNPCAQMRDMQDLPPMEVVGADGVWLELADGRRILDGIASWWCKALGHGHPHIVQALRDQAGRFEHVIAANTTHEGMVRLCERLLAMANGYGPEHWSPAAAPGKLPGALQWVFLADNGSTAVEIALKMALQAQARWGQSRRQGFACLAGAYHGESVGTLSVGDCDLYSAPFRSLMFPSLKLEQLPLRSGPDDPQWLDAGPEWPAIARQLDTQAETLAAIIYEPVLQGAGGMRVLSPDLLPRLRRWADAHGVLLIADEIASGFGRCGAMLASHLADPHNPAAALPDLCCVSKGLSAGASPLSAVLLSEAVYQAFYDDYGNGHNFLHSNTWTGHPLGVAVANAVLDVFAAEDMCAQVRTRGAVMRAGLAELASHFPFLGTVRGVGMMAAVDLEGFAPARRTGRQLFRAALAEEVLLRPLGDTSYLFPPLTISDDEISHLLSRLGRALATITPPG